MRPGFNHHREAQSYARTVADPRARVALGIVHHLILEAGGMKLRLLPDRCYPRESFNVLYFYKTVECLFSHWTEEIAHYPETPENRDRLLGLEEAVELIPRLPTELARIGLTNYLSILCHAVVSKGTLVDALFCSRLVSVLLSNSEILEIILSGDESWAAINPWEGILD